MNRLTGITYPTTRRPASATIRADAALPPQTRTIDHHLRLRRCRPADSVTDPALNLTQYGYDDENKPDHDH